MTVNQLFDRAMGVVVVVLAVCVLFGSGFVLGGVYTVHKHEAKFCPEPSVGRAAEFQAPDGQRIVGVRTGCRNGEDLFE